MERFRRQVFSEEVELRFLASKLDRDQIQYSLLRLRNGDLAFELHQRLQEGEASFEELAASYSEGDERHNGGHVGPVPLSQAHPQVVDKLRISQPGQLLDPFFLVDIWLILRLDAWQGARLDEDARSELLQELVRRLVASTVMRLLDGEQPDPLPLPYSAAAQRRSRVARASANPAIDLVVSKLTSPAARTTAEPADGQQPLAGSGLAPAAAELPARLFIGRIQQLSTKPRQHQGTGDRTDGRLMQRLQLRHLHIQPQLGHHPPQAVTAPVEGLLIQTTVCTGDQRPMRCQRLGIAEPGHRLLTTALRQRFRCICPRLQQTSRLVQLLLQFRIAVGHVIPQQPVGQHLQRLAHLQHPRPGVGHHGQHPIDLPDLFPRLSPRAS